MKKCNLKNFFIVKDVNFFHCSLLKITFPVAPVSAELLTAVIIGTFSIFFHLLTFQSRLLQYEADLKDGKKLSEQQIEARYCIGEVDTQLEFLKDISRVLQSLQKEYLRNVKQRDDGMKKDVG